MASGPKDVGVQTSNVLGAAEGNAGALAAAAARRFEAHPRGAAGNGSLMRTAPVALAHLGDDRAIVDHAVAVSALTHGDPVAGEACALWCIAIDRAVREEGLDGIDDGLALLYPDRRVFWWAEPSSVACASTPRRWGHTRAGAAGSSAALSFVLPRGGEQGGVADAPAAHRDRAGRGAFARLARARRGSVGSSRPARSLSRWPRPP
jgi:hypothetical protein